MLKPRKKSKVTICHTPNGSVCNECEDYEICIAENKVEGIKPVFETKIEGESEEELDGKEN